MKAPSVLKKRPPFAGKALFPASFDPITLGHVDVIRRIAPFFESLTALAANSSKKNHWLSLKERERMARLALSSVPRARVESWPGLTARYAEKEGIFILVRSVRSFKDLRYERDMALANKKIFPKLETFFVFASLKSAAISSRSAKEAALQGQSLKRLLPPEIIPLVEAKIKSAPPSSV